MHLDLFSYLPFRPFQISCNAVLVHFPSSNVSSAKRRKQIMFISIFQNFLTKSRRSGAGGLEGYCGDYISIICLEVCWLSWDGQIFVSTFGLTECEWSIVRTSADYLLFNIVLRTFSLVERGLSSVCITRGFFCPSGKKRAFYAVLAFIRQFLVFSSNLSNF